VPAARINKSLPPACVIASAMAIDRLCDLRQSTLYGGCHLLIFLVDDPSHFEGGQRVQARREARFSAAQSLRLRRVALAGTHGRQYPQ